MSPAEAFSDLTRREDFFALAARIFGVDRATIDGTTAYESIAGWDSVNHLRDGSKSEFQNGVQQLFW